MGIVINKVIDLEKYKEDKYQGFISPVADFLGMSNQRLTKIFDKLNDLSGKNKRDIRLPLKMEIWGEIYE